MTLKTAKRGRALNEMIDIVCDWYGIDREELKAIGVITLCWIESDYVGALFAFEEWRERYYREDNLKGGGEV